MIDLVLLDELPPDEELPGPRPDPGFIWNITEMGVLSPVILEQLPDTGAILVRSGKRRVKAARVVRDTLGQLAEAHPDDAEAQQRFAAAQRIPAQWVASNGTGALVDIGTNLQRPNPFSDLEAIEELLARKRFEEGSGVGADLATHNELKEVARRTGLPFATVAKRYELHPLPFAVRQAVASGKLAMGVAARIAKLGERQRLELAERIAAGEKVGNADVTALTRARAAQAAAGLDLGFLDDAEEAPRQPTPTLALIAARGIEAKLTGEIAPVSKRERDDGFEWEVLGPDGQVYAVTLVVAVREEGGDGDGA